MEAIEVLETSLGQRRNYPKYIGLTVGAGAIVGAAISAIAWEPCTFLCFGPFDSETRGETVRLGFFVGALAGLPLGGLMGFILGPEERWSPAPIPGRRLTIRPMIGGRFGFAASIPVGGLYSTGSVAHQASGRRR